MTTIRLPKHRSCLTIPWTFSFYRIRMHLLLLCANCFYWSTSFGQLDTVTGSVALVSIDYQDVDTVIPQDWIVLTLVPNDMSDLGFLSVVVYSQAGGNVLLELYKTKQQLIDENLIVDDTIVITLLFYDPYFTYRIDVYPQTNAESYTPNIELIYPN
jgi:hypothetical protein